MVETTDGVVGVIKDYPLRSLLADARIPMGATVTPILQARHWRSVDARRGIGFSRRQRVRARKQFREPWVYVPNDITHKKEHFKIFLGGGNSTRGRTG